MMAALAAADQGAQVCLLERNQKVGRKLYITGKGRCNVTNHCPVEQVLASTPRNSRFLYGAMTRTPPQWVENFFEELGVPLKVERGNRVFPQSDRSADIIDALFRALQRRRVPILQDRILELNPQEDGTFTVVGEGSEYSARTVVLATGGASYPATGSTGDGYAMAEALGHTIVPAKPSLVPLEAEESFCAQMQGLALKNVVLKVKNKKKKVIFQEQGELLFTHFGLSGPLVLSASAHANWAKETYTAVIDLKPALEEAKLEARILRDIAQAPNKAFHNFLEGLLPRKMVPVMAQRVEIPPDLPVNALTRGQRRHLVEAMKAFSVPIAGTRPIKEAIITAGGVKTGEVDPGTMMSKKVAGLFFAGEVLDVDGYTGGFNLQIAWCTGRAAGQGAARYIEEDGT